MPRRTRAKSGLPDPARDLLAQLGRNLEVARRRRGESRSAFADRIFASVPTLRRLERGDPGVSIGVLASALWALGLHRDLALVASADRDEVGKALALRRLPKFEKPRATADRDF